MIFITSDPEQTINLGEKIGKHLIFGDVLLLIGDLGAGKTTLVQGICKGLDVKSKEYVRSPTFTLVNEYQGKYQIFHIDLYRTETTGDIENLGLEEFLNGKGVCLVEWAEKLLSTEPKSLESITNHSWIKIQLSFEPEDKRKITISPSNFLPKSHPIFTLH